MLSENGKPKAPNSKTNIMTKGLADLTPQLGHQWKVQAKVHFINTVRTWSNPTSAGKLQLMCLKDDLGCKMCLTLFNTAVDRLNFLEKGGEYIFSEGNIKKAHGEYSQFGAQKHPYQINMDDKAGKIEKLNDPEPLINTTAIH